MADYVVDVRAKLNIAQYKKDLDSVTRSKTFTVKINPEVAVLKTLSSESLGNLSGLKDNIQQWFSKKENAISLHFKYKPDQETTEDLKTVREALRTVGKVEIPVNVSKDDLDTLKKLQTYLPKISEALTDLNGKQTINFSAGDVETFKTQVQTIQNVLKEFKPVDIKIGFISEELTSLFKNITDIETSLKKLNNVEIKPPAELTDSITKYIYLDFDKDQKEKIEESIKNLEELLDKLKNIDVSIKFNEEQETKFKTAISELDVILNKLRIIDVFTSFNKEQKAKFEQEIKDIQAEEQKVATIDVKLNLPADEKNKLKFSDDPIKVFLSPNLNQLKTFRTTVNQWIKENSLIATFIKDDKNLSNIKKDIDSYFEQNPIKLALSKETSGLDLQGFTDAINKLYQDQQNALSQLTKQQIEENKNALEKQASDVLSHYDEIKIQRKNDILDAEQYYERLKLLAEDENNNKILLETKHSADLRKIRQDLAQAKIDLDKEEVQREKNTLDEVSNIVSNVQQEINQASNEIDKIISDTNERIAQEAVDNVSSYVETLNEINNVVEKTTNDMAQETVDGVSSYFQAINEIEQITENANEEIAEQGAENQRRIRQESIREAREANRQELSQQREDMENAEAERQRQRQEASNQRHQDAVARQQEREQERQQERQNLEDRYIDILSFAGNIRDALGHMEMDVNVQEIVEPYVEAIRQIDTLYKQGSMDFQVFTQQILQQIRDAYAGGVIPEEVIRSTEEYLRRESVRFVEERTRTLEAEQRQQIRLLQTYAQQQAQIARQASQEAVQYSRQGQQQQSQISLQTAQTAVQNIQNASQQIQRIISQSSSQIQQAMQPIAGAFQNVTNQAQQYVNTATQRIQRQVEQTNQAVQHQVQNTANIFRNLMQYFGITQLIGTVQSSFRQMVQEVRDLDVELTEFSKVTDLTAEETQNFIDKCYDLGDAVARTGTEVVQATTLFKKMGYTVDQSMDFAKDALMWTNVADGVVSVESSTNMLISTMKAFEKQGISSTHVIDALNEVSNNYSTSSSALSENLSVVASTLAVSGTTFEQTIGLMTAGIEIMPDRASKVANGLKTISQRIRQIDGDTADKLDEFLGRKGISRFDEITGQLKGTYQILEEISKEWDNLTENERQYIGEVMAGKNQITVLNALMMNFKTAINATETAMNSAGSAAKENERVLDSIQGHIQRLQSSFEELSKNIINSEAFKQVVDFGTNLIKIINNLTDNQGKQILLLVGAITATVTNSVQRFNNGFQQAQDRIRQFNRDLQEAQLNGRRFDETFRNLQTRGEYFDSIVSGARLATTTIGLLIAAYAGVIQIIDNLEEKRKQQYQEEIDALDEETKKIQQLQKLEEEYLEANTLEKRQALYDKILDIKAEIANLDQSELSRAELLTAEIGKQNDLYDDQLAKLTLLSIEKEQENQKRQNVHSGFLGIARNMPGREGSYGTDPHGRDEISRVLKQLQQYEEDYFDGKTYQGFLGDAYNSIQNKIDMLLKLRDEIKDELRNYKPDEQIYQDLKNVYDYIGDDLVQLQKDNEDIMSKAKILGETVLGDLSSYTDEELKSMQQLFDAISTGSQEDMVKALLELRDVFGEDLEENFIQEIIDNLSKPDVAQYVYDWIEKFRLMKEASEAYKNSIHGHWDEIATDLSVAISTIDNYASNVEILNQAQEDLNNIGTITSETFKKIADAGLESYLIIDEATGAITLNREAFEQDNKALEDNAIASFVAGQEQELLAEVQEMTGKSANNAAGAANAYKSAMDLLIETGKDLTAANIAEALSFDLVNAGINETAISAEDVQAKIDDYVTKIQNGIGTIRGYFSGLGSSSTSTSRGASNSSRSDSSRSSSSSNREAQQAQREAEQAQREAEKALREAQQAFKDGFQSLYNELKTYLDLGAITEKEYYDSLEILVDKFYKDREGYEEEYWKYHDEIVKGRKKYLEKEMEDLFKKGETVLKRQLDAEVITYEEYFDSLEQLYKSYYTDKEDFENAMWELEKERYEHQIEEFDKQIKEYEDELSSLFKKGEKLLKHQLEMDELTQEEYLERLEVLYRASITDQEELEDKLLEIKEERYKLEKKKQEEHLKELEKQLEEYYDEVKEMHDEYVKSLEDDAESIDAVISYAIDVLDDEISKLEEEKKALDEANSALEEQIKLQELEENLQKAKNRKIRVYRKGQGFVYEEDTKAVSEAQSAIDEYKKELAHKKEISMIDERIKQLQKYKEAWSNIPKEYKKAQNELLALQRAGSDAQKKILNGDQAFINEFVRQYNTTQDKLSEANKRNIDEINNFIFGTEEGAGLKQKIDQINSEIERVKSIEIKALIKGGEEGSGDSLEEIIDKIKNLTSENGPIAKLNKKKIELQAEWKIVNGESQYNTIINNINNIQAELDKIKVKDLNITNWCNNIDSMIKKLQDLTTAANNASSAGIDVGNIGEGTYNPNGGNTGGGNGGFNVGDWVTLPDSDISYAPFKGKRFQIVQFENQDMTYNPSGDYAAVLVEGGTGGSVTYRVPVSHLSASSSEGNPSDDYSSGQPYSEPVKDTNGKIIGYNWYNPDGSFLYYEAAHASGTLGTTTKTFMVNENGLEAMVTPEGTVISAPSTGYGVIKNEYTERLTDFASDPMGFLSKAFSGYSGTYKNNSSTNETININGNLTLPNVTNGESFVDSIRNLALQYTTRRK